MAPRLAEWLYWMACWIAATVAILVCAAILGGGDRLSWISVAAFVVTAGAIWLAGRFVLLCAKHGFRLKRR